MRRIINKISNEDEDVRTIGEKRVAASLAAHEKYKRSYLSDDHNSYVIPPEDKKYIREGYVSSIEDTRTPAQTVVDMERNADDNYDRNPQYQRFNTGPNLGTVSVIPSSNMNTPVKNVRPRFEGTYETVEEEMENGGGKYKKKSRKSRKSIKIRRSRQIRRSRKSKKSRKK